MYHSIFCAIWNLKKKKTNSWNVLLKNDFRIAVIIRLVLTVSCVLLVSMVTRLCVHVALVLVHCYPTVLVILVFKMEMITIVQIVNLDTLADTATSIYFYYSLIKMIYQLAQKIKKLLNMIFKELVTLSKMQFKLRLESAAWAARILLSSTWSASLRIVATDVVQYLSPQALWELLMLFDKAAGSYAKNCMSVSHLDMSRATNLKRNGMDSYRGSAVSDLHSERIIWPDSSSHQ